MVILSEKKQDLRPLHVLYYTLNIPCLVYINKNMIYFTGFGFPNKTGFEPEHLPI